MKQFSVLQTTHCHCRRNTHMLSGWNHSAAEIVSTTFSDIMSAISASWEVLRSREISRELLHDYVEGRMNKATQQREKLETKNAQLQNAILDVSTNKPSARHNLYDFFTEGCKYPNKW